jgi:hypothetical protein
VTSAHSLRLYNLYWVICAICGFPASILLPPVALDANISRADIYPPPQCYFILATIIRDLVIPLYTLRRIRSVISIQHRRLCSLIGWQAMSGVPREDSSTPRGVGREYI